MTYKNKIILICVLLCSCSFAQKNKDIKIIKEYLYSSKKDSLFRNEHKYLDIDFSSRFLEENQPPSKVIVEYLNWQKENTPTSIFYTYWCNPSEAFQLNNYEITNITLEILKEEKYERQKTWHEKSFNDTPRLKIINQKEQEELNANKIGKHLLIYSISSPIIVIKGSEKYAFLYVLQKLNETSIDTDGKMVVMKFKNGHWDFIGEIYRK